MVYKILKWPVDALVKKFVVIVARDVKLHLFYVLPVRI